MHENKEINEISRRGERLKEMIEGQERTRNNKRRDGRNELHIYIFDCNS
jgi:hypothetical protein